MTASVPAPPKLGRLPRSILLHQVGDAARLRPVPSRLLPALDDWMIATGAHGLLHAEGHLDGAAERLGLPLLAVAPEWPAVWLVGAAWVELGIHALGEDGEARAALLLCAQRWCDALRQELRHDQ